MRKLGFTIVPLLFASANAFAYSQPVAVNTADLNNIGIGIADIDIPVTFTGTTLALAGNGTPELGALEFKDLNFGVGNTDNFRAFAETIGGPLSVNFVVSHLALTTFAIPVPQAVLGGFFADVPVTFHFGSPSTNPVGSDYPFLNAATLSNTPVPLSAALPLFLGGLLVLVRTAFRRSESDIDNATAA